MTPSDLPALARMLDALVPHRTVGQLADDPQETHVLVGRLETAGLTADVPVRQPAPGGELRRDQRERHRCPLWLCPSPLFRPGGGHQPAARRALSRPRSAERSEGSLDRRSPPRR